ncbi:MAG: hypothetical protein M3280_06280 [Actinomycetota bacterium]|nr:hypothetical protein [Actinomycetota bacterium]
MPDETAVDLEFTIRQMPGVLGCVILTHPDQGFPEEIQAFVRAGTDRAATQERILNEANRLGLQNSLRQVLVFELQAASHLGDRESLQRAAEMAEQEARARGPVQDEVVEEIELGAVLPPPLERRPKLDRVLLSSTTWRSEAQVALGPEGESVVGEAHGEKTPHGLKVLAQATLEAASRLAGGIEIELIGASLVNTFGREAVLVAVKLGDSGETLGAALVREGPISEAAVRATLDALNRRMAQRG